MLRELFLEVGAVRVLGAPRAPLLHALKRALEIPRAKRAQRVVVKRLKRVVSLL